MKLLIVVFFLSLLQISLSQSSDETVLTEEDFNNVGKLPRASQTKADPTSADNSVSGADLFEGDINLDGKQLSEFIVQQGDDPNRVDNAIVDSYKRWPGAQVPYTISTDFQAWERARIAEAIQAYHSYTCIRWVPRTTQYNYVHFYRGNGCWSLVGMVGGRQLISLGNGCVWTGIIIHEMMHAVGFWHEQSRNDRDNYVRIFYNEVTPGLEHNFDKYDLRTITHLGTEYDYYSIMHYGAYSFSSTGRMTIQPLYASASVIGQRERLSDNDIRKLNILYYCNVGPVQTTTRRTITTTTTTSRPTGTCADTRDDCYYFSNDCGQTWTQSACALTCGHCRSTARPGPGGRRAWVIND